jgi:hypothetical protein
MKPVTSHSRRIRAVVLAIATVIMATSCVVDDEGDAVTPIDPVKVHLHGRVQVNLVEATLFSEAYTTVLGRVNNGPTPSTLQWTQADSSGSCKLMIPRAPFCAVSCGSTAACVADGVCQDYPKALVVGSMTVNGMKTVAGPTSFVMQPLLGTYQPPATTQFVAPPFTEGDDVTISAGTDSTGLFSLTAKAMGPLQVLYDSIVLTDNQAVTLQWTPPSAASSSTVSARFDISHHGGVKGVIECESADNGQLIVAASLVNQLKALGISGFPTVELSRHSASPVRTDMSLELRIESMVVRPISIPGLISCSGDEECPNGQTCQQDLKCQ